MDTIQAHDPRKPVYKKPLFWIILVVILAAIITTVCFLTVPKKDKMDPPSFDEESEAALDEATLCTIWMLAEVEAPDGSSGSAYSLGLR